MCVLHMENRNYDAQVKLSVSYITCDTHFKFQMEEAFQTKAPLIYCTIYTFLWFTFAN
jgi:hypothetical protein